MLALTNLHLTLVMNKVLLVKHQTWLPSYSGDAQYEYTYTCVLALHQAAVPKACQS